MIEDYWPKRKKIPIDIDPKDGVQYAQDPGENTIGLPSWFRVQNTRAR
jgi:hypothetical protein